MNYFKLCILWVVMAIIVNPIGEFPLNDDWAYYKDVLFLIQNGHLELVDWSAMTLVSQIFIGFLFCKVCGFSFTALRILTLIIGLFGILATYKVLKEITFSDKLSFFVSVLIMGNPLFFSLSNTFMTDIYFYTFSVIAIFYLNRSLNSGKTQQIIIATIFILIATLIRQIGIIIPVSFMLVCLYKSNPLKRSSIFKSMIPLFFTALALFIFNYWISVPHKNLTYFSAETIFSNLGIKTFSHIFYRIGTSGMTLGFFLFPLLLILIPNFKAGLLKKENRVILLLTAIFSISLVRAWTNTPVGNIFFDFGLGPKLLKDVYVLNNNNYYSLNSFVLTIFRVVSFAGGILLFYAFFSYLFNIKKNVSPVIFNVQKTKLFAFIIIVLLFATFVIPDFFFDRYLIQLMIPLIIMILPYFEINLRSKLFIFSYSLVFLFMLFSAGLTHDYIAWNRARWQGLNYLMTDLKRSPKEIDGGFEFNRWYQTAPILEKKIVNFGAGGKNDFILTFGPLPEYKTLKLFPYYQYIPFEKRDIYILYKDTIDQVQNR